jgi:manganese/zinc/iron transport system permease protein
MDLDWQTDGWIIVAGALCAIAAALVGNFLVLRRLSLMGDAISHSVLPGIAAAFLFSGTRGSFAVLIGAAVMGLLTVWLTELIRRYGQVEESAAIGVVYTSLFAIGLILIDKAGDKIDLDPSCVLYGGLETVTLRMVETPFGAVPSVVITLGVVCCVNFLCIAVFFKQWQISTFDPLLAQAQGVSPSLFHYVLASLVAVTCIASMEAVGNILVVAMLVVPSATAFLLCKRLHSMIVLSVVIGTASAVLGHLLARGVPFGFGFRSVNSAAMMAVTSGLFLIVAVFASPKAGMLVRWIEQRSVARKILGEDILALLYRRSERTMSTSVVSESNFATVDRPPLVSNDIALQLKIALRRVNSVVSELVRAGWVSTSQTSLSLTDNGRRVAQNLIRSHRLWEQYLSVEVSASDARLHAQAESLEHFTSSSMRDKLDAETGQSTLDPHGRSIPPEG